MKIKKIKKIDKALKKDMKVLNRLHEKRCAEDVSWCERDRCKPLVQIANDLQIARNFIFALKQFIKENERKVEVQRLAQEYASGNSKVWKKITEIIPKADWGIILSNLKDEDLASNVAQKIRDFTT